ncbi:MAG: beta-galactosidase, partial [Kiritimatiellae bacterium]|nr:beta-galactosidase [Kiritimatiellia bacterium]
MFAASGTLAGTFIEMRDGYFWNPSASNYWVPHGFAYQTINGNVFANQTVEQLDYDMLEMRKIHADSLRVDFTWGNIETNNDMFNWTMTDHIVAKAEELGLRLFPLIGYQYAPSWFSSGWKAVNASNQTTALLNYEHPLARAAYTDFLAHVTARYKDSPAIAGWILGNEYAYFDLWEANDPHLFVGYDTNYSLPSFRAYLTNLYAGSISALNANWGTGYGSFDSVPMPTNYPGANDPGNVHLQNRYYPAYHDLIQWRKKSIGDFVALGSVAAKNADTNHLRSYSMVGGIYNGFDANYTCEDAKTIVARCATNGAPLDFWAINNYAWALENNELRTAQFGITKYQDQSGLPVLVTETGHSSTESEFPGASPRQPKALPGQVWEAVMAGAAGVHIFTWNDRPMPQVRERGFGIIQTNRLIKNPVYWNVAETFRRMEQVNIHGLFGASLDPARDINFYWSSDADMVWGRANQENCMLWGGLKRLGYEPRFIDGDQLDAGAYTNAPVLLLSHAFMMQGQRLNDLTNVIADGVNLHANAALPGRYDPYHKENSGWAATISDLFGLTVSSATNTWHGGISGPWDQPYSAVQQVYDTSLAPLSPSYPWTHTVTWIKMQNVTANSGTTVVHTTEGTGYPTLQIKGHGAQGRAAINTWTLGDTTTGGGSWQVSPYDAHMVWQLHYDWARAIYRTWFGMIPQVDLSGAGYFYVVPDYRVCTNGSVLISLLNESTNAATITVSATNLITGLTVEQLSPAGGVLESNSDGAVTITLAGDQYVLLYAYADGASLANPSAYKIWLADEPPGIWPNGQTFSTEVGYDTRGATLDLHLAFERADSPFTRYAATNASSVSGIGTNE